ncbi:hypothetical protein H2200_001884 [Cladophialophora chaetospira]|uniref:Uncharacterized protein n=1 Tax=Cladophialophora chaetospira TaxID=386627 RepID=A0AA38XLQ1_9EURO|nr:hypothetical protein H2200_001884 [Cladophialophora chaetospira]
MPCQWMSRGRTQTKMAESTANIADGNVSCGSANSEVETWKDIRRYNLRMMRKQVRYIVLLMALIEALRVGPIELVYAGKHGYPAPAEDDFGIAYTMGGFLSWLYVCLFMIIWIPFFNWWVVKLFPDTPEDPSNPSTGMKFLCFVKKLNMVLLPISIGINLITYACYLGHTFIYVDSRPHGSKTLPKNTRKNWAVRAFMLLGIAISTSVGYGSFQILAEMDLAHVKTLEYAIIVVPFQINFGIFFGSVMQWKMEKRIARKQALLAARVEEGVADEKAALVEV